MIRPTYTEYDYIITNMNGNVDCFSKGISSLINIPSSTFKENNSGVNIMVLCPELLEMFETRRKIIKGTPMKRNNMDMSLESNV
jgi:hypothetical protein